MPYTQFILDADLLGRTPTEGECRWLAELVASTFAALVEEVSEGDSAIKGSVLCGWRVWGSDGASPLSSDPVRVPPLLEGQFVVLSEHGEVLPPVRSCSGDMGPRPDFRGHGLFGVDAVRGRVYDQEDDFCG